MILYITGFLFSLLFTIEAYFLANRQTLTYWPLVFVLLALAISQAAVQLFFFLRLGKEKNPRWKLITLLCAVIVITIIVGGSMWIMTNLNYNHSHTLLQKQSDGYIIKDEGF